MSKRIMQAINLLTVLLTLSTSVVVLQDDKTIDVPKHTESEVASPQSNHEEEIIMFD